MQTNKIMQKNNIQKGRAERAPLLAAQFLQKMVNNINCKSLRLKAKKRKKKKAPWLVSPWRSVAIYGAAGTWWSHSPAGYNFSVAGGRPMLC